MEEGARGCNEGGLKIREGGRGWCIERADSRGHNLGYQQGEGRFSPKGATREVKKMGVQ